MCILCAAGSADEAEPLAKAKVEIKDLKVKLALFESTKTSLEAKITLLEREMETVKVV